jgi:hypothetical protein
MPVPPNTPVDELLAALSGGDRQAAVTLKARRNEAGTRELVSGLAEQTRDPNMALAELLVRLGGRGSREALDRMLVAYASSPRTFDKNESGRWASDAIQVAGYVLGLTPDDDRAAELLVRLFRHPTSYIRMRSVWVAAAIYSHGCQPEVGTGAIRTVAMDRLLDGLQQIADEEDDELFIKAIPALAAPWEANTAAMVARCETIVSGTNAEHRRQVIGQLLQSHWPFRFMPMIWRWLAKEPFLRTRIEVACSLSGAVPSALLLDLCRAGLADTSPSIRYRAMLLLDQVEEEVRRQLVAAALEEEPDPELQAEMARILECR